MSYCKQHFVTAAFLIERLGSISYRVKTITSAQGRTSCLSLTFILSSTAHFQTRDRLYCTQSFCRFSREILKLRLLHHHYQQKDLRNSRFDLFFMGVAFSIFSLVDLGVFCHLKRVYTLTFRKCVPFVCTKCCTASVFHRNFIYFCPTVTPTWER